MNYDLGQLFPGTQNIPGVGYISIPYVGAHPRDDKAVNGLGDESAVMMISGIGASGDRASSTSNQDASGNFVAQALLQIPSISDLLKAKVRIGTYEIPVWALALIVASGLGIAGWYFFQGKKK